MYKKKKIIMFKNDKKFICNPCKSDSCDDCDSLVSISDREHKKRISSSSKDIKSRTKYISPLQHFRASYPT